MRASFGQELPKTVLITGATGFLGRYITQEFFSAGWRPVGIGTRQPENAPLQHLVQYYQLKLPDRNLGEIIRQHLPEVCVHCAGRASVDLSVTDPESDFRSSVDMTFNLLDMLRRYSPKCKVIFLSSAASYGDSQTLPMRESHPASPVSPYGFHKFISEQICKEFFTVYSMPTVVARIFSAYGPGLRRQVIWDICLKAMTQPVLRLLGTGNESRDFVHARDIARSIILLTEKAPCRGEVYNVGSGIESSILELARLVLSQMKKDMPIEFHGRVPTHTPVNWRADIGQLAKLGFTISISLQDGIRNFVDWCKAEIVAK